MDRLHERDPRWIEYNEEIASFEERIWWLLEQRKTGRSTLTCAETDRMIANLRQRIDSCTKSRDALQY